MRERGPTWELPWRAQIPRYVVGVLLGSALVWCATIGESTDRRILLNVLTIVGGTGFYLVAWFVMRPNPMSADEKKRVLDPVNRSPNGSTQSAVEDGA
jgi:hypothetical protein